MELQDEVKLPQAPTSEFNSVIHKLIEEQYWEHLDAYLNSVEASSSDDIKEQLLKREGKHSWTPLMCSLAKDAPPNIIQLLLGKCPDSISIPDIGGSFPLHFLLKFCRSGKDKEEQKVLNKILDHLLAFGPEFLKKKNKWGETPLHSVFESDELPRVETINILLGLPNELSEIRDDATSISEKTEEEMELSRKVVRRHSKKALATKDSDQCLPLHLAAKKGADAQILKLLVAASPNAVFCATAKGDLPIHLLQFYSEDAIKRAHDGKFKRRGSWLGETSIFRLQRSIDLITSSQVEALLEPWCDDYVGNMDDEEDEEVQPHDQNIQDDSKSSHSGSTLDIHNQEVAALALPGSRNMYLPIHIAAEHGVSKKILHVLCDKYPEGVETPHQTLKAGYVASNSSLSGSDDRYKGRNIYPLEMFEKGRASVEASAAAREVYNEQGFERQSVESHVVKKYREILRDYEERSDLLFAYYPDAVKSIFNQMARITCGNDVNVPFRKDPNRLDRLETQIRNDVLEPSIECIGKVSRLVWLWLYNGVNKEMDKKVTDGFGASVSRIVTGLPEDALLKLSFLTLEANVKNSNYLECEPCLIRGQSILDYAKERGFNMNFDDLLESHEKSNKNLLFNICEFLDAIDALSFSATCKTVMRSGVRILPETKLKETGRNWNLPARDELSGPGHSEFWQHLDSKFVLPASTHTVLVAYYLETSDTTAGMVDLLSSPPGGLLVASESSNSSDTVTIETNSQKRLLNSFISTATGFEVQLKFRIIPGRSYSLRVFGPKMGGRVSVSNVRIRQVINCYDCLKRSPMETLLTSKPEYTFSPLSDQIKILCEERYGFDDFSKNNLVHFALMNDISQEVIEALISSNPSLLLESDHQGRTPLHLVFAIPQKDPPSLGLVKLLLRTPGENATRLKDKSGKVPLHLAAEIGANNAILQLLVDSDPDGCYRRTNDGDIPIHLLVRSGKATTSSVEILLRPIMFSETICKLKGSIGVQLPLHIACQYNCTYEVINQLLSEYDAAANIPMTNGSNDQHLFALDLFESNRPISTRKSRRRSSTMSMMSVNSQKSLGAISLENIAKQNAKEDFEECDFNLRSDLIFVHNPLVSNSYRKDRKRIRRLRTYIIHEGLRHLENKGIRETNESIFSKLSKMAWYFLCTYEAENDFSDNYANDVNAILKELPIPIVKVLASMTNHAFDPPQMIVDCATPRCKYLLRSRCLFVRRYDFGEESSVLHHTEDSIVIGAHDHGATDIFDHIKKALEEEEEMSHIDDLPSDDEGSIAHKESSDVIMTLFLQFAAKLGFDEFFVKQELLLLNNKEGNELLDVDKIQLDSALFSSFCEHHNIDANGVRNVVIKFMKHRPQFLREKVTRARISLAPGETFAVPVFEDYDMDRVSNNDDFNSDIDDDYYEEDEDCDDMTEHSPSWDTVENKDEIFSSDLKELNTRDLDLTLYRYALVLPKGHDDLNDILAHKNLKDEEIKQYAFEIAIAIQQLHKRRVVHGNLTLSNVIKDSLGLSLTDFDSATSIGRRSFASILNDKICGVSQNFSTGILPPEAFVCLDPINKASDIHSIERYWNNIRQNAQDLATFSEAEKKILDTVLADLIFTEKGKERKTSALGEIRINIVDRLQEDGVSWKDILSASLLGRSFEDLPISLSTSETPECFLKNWNQLKDDEQLWESVRPKMSKNGKHAFTIRFFDDTRNDNNEKEDLPYKLVKSSEKIDIWSYGVLLFTLLTRCPPFRQSIDGNIEDVEEYEKLFNWSTEDTKKMMNSFKIDEVAQDLLLKILTRTEDRISSISAVLKHPFFSKQSIEYNGLNSNIEVDLPPCETEQEDEASSETHSTPSDEMDPLDKLSSSFGSVNSARFDKISMEKLCKIIYARLDDIKVPTSFIVLPYKLTWNENEKRLKAPSDLNSLALAEKVGRLLLNINTLTAKLSFWLRVKKILSESNGKEFKAKVMKWINRARTEGSINIAKEIVAEIKYGQEYEPICVEMLDEEMSISHARSYIQDPFKAAASLIRDTFDELIQCYHNQFVYLIDEHKGCPSTTHTLGSDDDTYPIKLVPNENEYKKILFPFINISIMVATANDGLTGVARLLGMESSGIPDSWKDCRLGLVHQQQLTGRSSIVNFATLQGILRKEYNMMQNDTPLLRTMPTIEETTDYSACEVELMTLESFFQRHDSLGIFAGLHRVHDHEDESLIFWTNEEDKVNSDSQKELSEALKRLEELQIEISHRRDLEDEFVKLNQRLNELKLKREQKVKRRKERERKVRVVSPESARSSWSKDRNVQKLKSSPPPLVPSSCDDSSERSNMKVLPK